jgi:hypothetical protein
MLWRTFKCNNIQQKSRVTGMKCKKNNKTYKKHKKETDHWAGFLYIKNPGFSQPCQLVP